MSTLFKEGSRGFYTKISQFIGLMVFIIVSLFTFSALFSSVFQVRLSLRELEKYGSKYDFSVNTKGLSFDNDINNQYNIEFLKQFYNEEAIRTNKVNFLSIDNDISRFNCSDTECVPDGEQLKKNLNPETGVDSFTSLIKNFNGNKVAAFLSFIFETNEGHGIVNKILEKNNEPQIDFTIGYVFNYKFTVDDLQSEKQYFSLNVVSKNWYDMYFKDDDENNWRNKSIYSSPINKVIKENHNTIDEINDNEIYLSRQYIENRDFKKPILNIYDLKLDIKGWAVRYSNIYVDLASQTTLALDKNVSVNFKNGSFIYGNYDTYEKIRQKTLSSDEDVSAYLSLKTDRILDETYKSKIMGDLLGNFFVSPDDNIINFGDSYPGQIVNLSNTVFIVDSSIAIACSIIICLVISFFIQRVVKAQRKRIGVLKALGYREWQLAFVYTFNLVLLLLISSALGYLLSIPLQMYFTSMNYNGIGLPLSMVYINVWIVLASILGVPLVLCTLAFIITFILIHENTLSLLYDTKSKFTKTKIHRHKILKKGFPIPINFNLRLSISFVTKSFGKWVSILVIFMFASFLLVFQLDAGVMTDGLVKNAYRFFNDDVKSYIIAEYDQQDLSNRQREFGSSSQGHTYAWEDKQHALENSYFKVDILEDSSKFNFPKPIDCLLNLNTKASKDSLVASCGDFLNITGYYDTNTGMVVDSKLKSKVVNGITKYPYLDKNTVEKIAHYKTTDDKGSETDGWINLANKIEDLLQNDFVIKYLKDHNIDIEKMYSLINYLRNIGKMTELIGDNYPDVFFGPNFVYDSKYDFPHIFKQARWNVNYYTYALTKLGLYGLTSNQDIRDEFINMKVKGMTKKQIQENIFDPVISPNIDESNITKFNNNKDKPINEAIPVIVSYPIARITNLKKNQEFVVDIRISDQIGYVPVLFKYMGTNEIDLMSSNIYANETSVYNVMKMWMEKRHIDYHLDSTYHNALATRIDDMGNSLQMLRLNSIFDLSNKYDFTIMDRSAGDIDFDALKSMNSNLIQLNSINKIYPLDIIRESVSKQMADINDVLIVLEILTVFIVAVVLMILINMILEENKRIILTMKVLGHKTKEIISIVLGFYLVSIIAGYIMSFFISKLLWNYLIDIIFRKTGLLLGLPYSLYVILVTIGITSVIVVSLVSLGLNKIKRNKLTHINLE